MILLTLTLAAAQERPDTGSACTPVLYSDFLVALTGRISEQSDRYVTAMDSGYDATESARKTLGAVIRNTRAQVATLGDCQGDVAYRDSVVRLVDFWDTMAQGELVTLTGFFLDGQISESEVAEASRITGDLGSRGTEVEDEVIRQQAIFAARFGFGVEGGTAAAPPPAAPPAPEPEPAPAPRPRPARSGPSVYLRLHGGLDMDYLFAFGRREDNYTAGADFALAGGFRLGGLYKHVAVGGREAERVHLILRYGLGSEGSKTISFGSALFVNPGVALVESNDPTVGVDFGGELTLGARLADRVSLGLYYRIAYEVWFDADSKAAESLGGWEVEPGLYLTVGI